MQPIKRSLTVSPLLSEKVIERDYTKGIETQLGGQQSTTYKAPEPQPDPNPISKPEPPPQQEFGHRFEEPAGFQFQEDIDPSDVTGDEPTGEGMNLAAGSAKAFANVIGDMIKVKVPEVSYQFVKVDLNSIESHIQNGNIQPALRDVFHQINATTLDALQFSDEEIKMWKKAFKEYLEYKNIAAANPETAFWIATGVLVLTQGIKVNQLSNMNKQYIVDAINSYNPGYFDSFRAKQNESKKPEAQAAPAAVPQTDGQAAKETKSEKTAAKETKSEKTTV